MKFPMLALSLFVLALLGGSGLNLVRAADSGGVSEGKQVWAGKKIFLDRKIVNSTLAGNVTLYPDSKQVQRMDPGGSSRNVTLPAVGTSEGYEFFIVNSADAAENLVVKNAGGSTIVTIGQGEAGYVWCDASAWYGFAFSAASSGFLAADGSAAGATGQAQDFGTNGVKADVVAESTGAAGVTVDGVLLKDGGFNYGTGGIGTAAAAGSNQGDGTALTKAINYITASDGTKGVVLPAAAAGLRCVVHNTVGTAVLKVYPASSDAIGTRSANAAIELPGGGNATFEAIDATTWIMNRGREGDGILQTAEVSITNTEMLNLRATPKTLVAAPGSGKVLEFVSAVLLFDYTGAYTESDDNLAVKYTDGSGAALSDAIESTGFVDATADTLTTARAKADAIVAKSGSENKALVLHNTGDGELGGGNAANAVRVKITYRVWSTGW
ncbi:MAG: hypothetical protein KIS92_00920 [Planctomycetota bacterium]|nr:hypothetical protein [Planctomycetota bacterium]